MPRPSHLPEFLRPPLAEVVLSVQFAQLPAYLSIYAYRVWDLFRDRLPVVSEQPELPPQFEVFGAAKVSRPEIRLQFSQQFAPRYWFASEDGVELVQFQKDRLIHNWRKLARPNNDYPRFERIAAGFEQDIVSLDNRAREEGWGQILPNQCELTYVNEIPLGSGSALDLLASYFNCLSFPEGGSDAEFAMRIVENVADADGNPTGRLHIGVATAWKPSGQKLLRFEIVGRGPPQQETIPSAIQMLHFLRNAVVEKFTAMTTQKAHADWERT